MMQSAAPQEPDVLLRPEREISRRRLPTTPLVCLVFGLIAASLGAWASAPWPACTPDSATYLNASRNLLETGAFLRTLTPVETIRSALPFASWPPLYPIAVGGVMGLGFDPPSAARLVQLVSLALLALPLGLLAMRIAGRSSIVPLLAFIVILRPQLVIASFVWTEPLFLLWTYGSLLLLVEALRPDRRTGYADLYLLFLAGALAGVAMLTRYAGAVVIATGGIVLLSQVEEEPSAGRSLGRIATFLAPALLPNLAWLIRNRIEVGFFFGEDRAAAVTDPQGILLEALRTIWTDTVMPPVTDAFIPRVALGLLGLLAVAFLAGIALHAFGSQADGRSGCRRTAANVMATFVILYGLSMVVLSVGFVQDPINTRLFAPIYPALLLLVAFLLRPIFSIDGSLGRRRLRHVAIIALAILWLTQATAGYRYLQGPREDRALTAPYWRSVAFVDPVWSDDETVRHLMAIAPRGTVVLTNLPDVVAIWTDRPTKMLPARDDPALEEKIAVHRRAVVMVHSDYRSNLAGRDELDSMVAGGRCWYLGHRGSGRFYRVRG